MNHLDAERDDFINDMRIFICDKFKINREMINDIDTYGRAKLV